MDSLPTPTLLAICGLAIGVIVGAVARSARFCTFGAIEDRVLMEDSRRVRAWGLAIAVAMAVVQLLNVFGIVPIEESFYLSADFGWAGAIVGGLLFGFGMALIGTCGYGSLIRLGGGDLRAFVVTLIIGLSAYMTARGLTGVLREAVIEPLSLDLSAIGGQGLFHLVAWSLETSQATASFWCCLVVVGAILFWCFRDAAFRASPTDVLAGSLIGLAVAAGFAATGIWGQDPFDPQQIESLTYVLPPGEAIVYLITFTGATANFGIGVVPGTILGAFLVAAKKRELRLEAFDDAREMRRYLIGACLMGVGGVTALGCTVGQGISGMATLSLSAPLALASIFAGASFGLHYLITGSLREALASFELTRRIAPR
ncbi:YeeE/YedE family protein [Pelagibius sp. Alg239-R121]|uniref:YeeE/YedE family protein n=1 Tax=Pelagibius sp. Alg239-R121 TaxID=2993448 RepID=UPI0024A711CC|nr:YeeE/YedE family protein [Pelagibius sp. Alg239-R121]